MRGERPLLRLGEYLVRQACARLPLAVREERYREWAAELPAILHDPHTRPTPRRAVRMLAYAADTVRGTAMTTPAEGRHRAPRKAATLDPFLVACLAVVGWDIWTVVRAPGHPLNYLQLAWGLLLVAYPITQLARFGLRVTARILISGLLVGLAVALWEVAQAPGDWVNYLVAALLIPPLLGMWLVSRWAHGDGQDAARTGRS